MTITSYNPRPAQTAIAKSTVLPSKLPSCSSKEWTRRGAIMCTPADPALQISLFRSSQSEMLKPLLSRQGTRWYQRQSRIHARCPFPAPPFASFGLPEATPSNIVLTQILQLRGFDNELVHLVDDIQLLVRLKVTSRKLLGHSVKHLNRPGVLALSLLRAVDLRAFWNRRTISAGPVSSHGGR